MRVWVPLILVMLVAGCGSEPSERATGPGEADGAPLGKEEAKIDIRRLDIGDIEQMVHFNLSVDPRSEGANVQVTAREDTHMRVRSLEVEVHPPFPKEFWLKTVLGSEEKYFSDSPLVVRVKYLRDETTVLNSFEDLLVQLEDGFVPYDPINVLAGMDEIPESVLITLDVECLLMPVGTDPATINPKTAATAPDRISHVSIGTVARINFVKDEEDSGTVEETGEGLSTEPVVLEENGDSPVEPTENGVQE